MAKKKTSIPETSDLASMVKMSIEADVKAATEQAVKVIFKEQFDAHQKAFERKTKELEKELETYRYLAVSLRSKMEKFEEREGKFLELVNAPLIRGAVTELNDLKLDMAKAMEKAKSILSSQELPRLKNALDELRKSFMKIGADI